MRPPRGLSASEAASWRRVADTVTPLTGAPRKPDVAQPSPLAPAGEVGGRSSQSPRPLPSNPIPARTRERNIEARTLDGTWERKLAKAQIAPDFEIDLHGDTLDTAYARLMASLGQAIAMQARLVLVIAGKARPHDEHGFDDHRGRGQRRGAIRAKLLDWLAASPHASRIAAVRPAAQRHGGAGAVYVVLRRARL